METFSWSQFGSNFYIKSHRVYLVIILVIAKHDENVRPRKACHSARNRCMWYPTTPPLCTNWQAPITE